jgi:hypothetical protein
MSEPDYSPVEGCTMSLMGPATTAVHSETPAIYCASFPAKQMAYGSLNIGGNTHPSSPGSSVNRLQPADTAQRLLERLESPSYHATLQSPSTNATP